MKLIVEETIGNLVEVEKLVTILEIMDFDAGLRQMLEAEQSNTMLATGNITLTDSDKVIQFVDPGGSDREIALPTVSINNHGFLIKNTADAWEKLTVKSGSTVLCTLHKAEMAWVISSGTVWNLGGVANRVREAVFYSIAPAGTVAVADGNGGYFIVPKSLHGMNLVYARAIHITAGSGGSPTLVQIANVTDSVDMLSTRIMIDVGEKDSNDATTPYVIDATKDDVAEGDLLRVDIDQVPTTAPAGLIVVLGFQEN